VQADILIHLDSHVVQEVRGNKERCDETVSMVTEYAYTIIECLADLYTAVGEREVDSLKSKLESFQTLVTAQKHEKYKLMQLSAI
jgi:hypothetical protein